MKFEKPKVSSSTPFKTEFKNAKRKSRDFNVIKQKSLNGCMLTVDSQAPIQNDFTIKCTCFISVFEPLIMP